MYRNYIFPSVNEALPALLGDLIQCDLVESRAGVTKELTHVGITLTDPLHREILLDDRKPNLAAQIAETMWVLAGRDDMEFLSHYLPRAKDFSDDGETWRAGYGARLRSWGRSGHGADLFPGDTSGTVDQLAYVVDLLKRDPGTRQAVMSIWDPAIDTEPGKDIPCNDWLHFISRLGYLDLHVAIRSNDVIWGWSGINQFEWSSLLEVVAGLTGLKVGSLHFSTTSFHLYEHHFKKAEKIAAGGNWAPLCTEPTPRFKIPQSVGGPNVFQFDDLCERWFQIEYDIRTGSPLVHHYIDTFPEPMLQSWLRVIDWWWNGDHQYLEPIGNTPLELATHYSVQPKSVVEPMKTTQTIHRVGIPCGADQGATATGPSVNCTACLAVGSDFIRKSIALHDKKHQAYGDSWKRRGEMLGIMANIARKVDRLGGSETADETSADTAMDLMIYLAKYRAWIGPTADAADEQGDHPANRVLVDTDLSLYPVLQSEIARDDHVHRLEQVLKEQFDHLEDIVTGFEDRDAEKAEHVQNMLGEAYRLAIFLDRVPVKEHDEYRGADVD